MSEEVLFEVERTTNRSEAADYLRTVAGTLACGDSIAPVAGDQHMAGSVPHRPTFEVEAERETPRSGDGTEPSTGFEPGGQRARDTPMTPSRPGVNRRDRW